MGAPASVVKSAFHARHRDRLVRRHELAECASPVGKICTAHAITPDDDGNAQKRPRLLLELPLDQVIRAHRGHHENPRDHRSAHVVRVLDQRPRVQQQPPEAGHLKLPSAARANATGCCIHASVTMMKNPESHDPTNTANPAHQCPQRLSRPSPYRNSPRNADSRKNENTPFHHQRLSDHAARQPRELRPVGAELKLHGDSGHHSEHEVDPEHPSPEARRALVHRVAGAQIHRFENHDERRQPHRELGKQVVKCDGKCKVEPMQDERVVHNCPINPLFVVRKPIVAPRKAVSASDTRLET